MNANVIGRKVEQIEIGGVTYRIKQLGTSAGSDIFFRVAMQTLAVFTEKARAEAKGAAATDMMAALRGAPDDFAAAREAFAAETTIVIRQANAAQIAAVEIPRPLTDTFEDHFAGRWIDFTAWFLAHLELNFGPFFQELQKDEPTIAMQQIAAVLSRLGVVAPIVVPSSPSSAPSATSSTKMESTGSSMGPSRRAGSAR